jgi:hypothetical protein
MLQRQPWMTGPGSIADTLAKTLLAVHGVEARGAERVRAMGRVGQSSSSAEQDRQQDKRIARRRAAAFSRCRRGRKAQVASTASP